VRYCGQCAFGACSKGRVTSGFIRADVVEGPVDAPKAAYDLKIGSATLTPARTQQIQSQIPGGSSVPVDMAIQIYGSYRFTRSESQTGLHSDPLLGLLIADVDKAAKNLDPGTLAKTPEGETFFLRNLNGDTLYQDKDGAHIKRQPKSKCDPKTCT
jgi:hypothetical protein